MRIGKLTLQLSAGPDRPHCVKARVTVHVDPDGTMAVFRGRRRIANFDAQGKLPDSDARQAA